MIRLNQISLMLLCCLLGLRLSATMVTFQADLSSLPSISPNGVHMMGPFNNWNPATVAMTAVGNGRFTLTRAFTAGEYIQFKFVNGNAYGVEEAVYGDCAFGTYRYLVVPAADTILPWVCYGACDSACTAATGTRIACIGNSITYGLGLPNYILQSYPSLLQDSLGPSYLVTNFGAPGAAVIRHAGYPYVMTEVFSHAIRYAPETVLLMLGTNDSKSAIWGPFSADFETDYDTLCLAFDTLATQPRMVLCLPATIFNHLFGLNDSVLAHAIIPTIKAQARRRAWDQFDLHTFTSGMVDLYLDSVHPGVLATDSIAREVLRYLRLPRPHITRVGSDLVAPPGWGWQWYYNGDTVPTALGGQSQVLHAVPVGDYKVAVRVDSVLAHILVSDSLTVMVDAQAEQAGPNLKIVPNPVHERLQWQVTGMDPLAEMQLRLIGLDGKLHRAWIEKATAGMIELGGLPAGTYILELRQGADVARRLIVKE